MDISAQAHAAVTPDQLHEVVADLRTYENWLGLVGEAEVLIPESPTDLPAWSVALQAQLGPLRRSKLLRMVRTEDLVAADGLTSRVVFERQEVDGRDHSPWVLIAEVSSAAADGPSELEMRLHYGGSLFVPLVERVLRAEIEASRRRLGAYLAHRYGDG